MILNTDLCTRLFPEAFAWQKLSAFNFQAYSTACSIAETTKRFVTPRALRATETAGPRSDSGLPDTVFAAHFGAIRRKP